MDYRVASNIRGKSLSSLITDRITSGGSVGSSIRGSISDKLKAKGTGIKEKFDPMNIARAMTGGSRLAPAILGRLTGRSQSDINYFAGDKNKTERSYTRMPTSMGTPGEGLGGSAVEVLNRMLAFMQKTRKDDLKSKETAKQFTEEQKVEDQRRHKEFLDVLKEYTSLDGTTTLVKGGDRDSDILGTVKKMLDAITKKFEKMLDSIDVFKNRAALRLLVGLLTNPLGLVIVGMVGLTYGLNKLVENMPNYNVITPQQAQYILKTGATGTQQGLANIQAAGGYEKLANIIRNSPAEAQKALEDYRTGVITDIELNKLGGKDKLEEIAKQTDFVVPEMMMPSKVSPRPERRGYDQNQWDKLYGEYYNSDGTLKTTATPLPGGVTPSNAGGGRGSVNPSMTPDSDSMSTPGSTTPVPQTPVSSRLEGLGAIAQISEDEFRNPPAILTTNTSTVDLPDRPIPATATVRDNTPILDYVLRGLGAPI